MVRVFVFLVIIAGCTNISFGQDSLKVLTWNIQMLPSFAKAGGKAKRAIAIVEQLKKRDDDVIVFQEIFHKRSRRIIRQGLEKIFPYHTPVLNKKTFALKSNGGVMIFSKVPIQSTKEIRFDDRQGFDRMARKGALLAELNVNGKIIHIAGTHLQAFGTQEILYSQYRQISDDLLKKYSKPDVPQLICGDFNTLKNIPPGLPDSIARDFAKRLPRYFHMLETLEVEDGDLVGEQQFTMDRPFNDMCKTRKQNRLLLDYILLKTNRSSLKISKRQVQIIRQQWHSSHQDLSDHFGVEAILYGF